APSSSSAMVTPLMVNGPTSVSISTVFMWSSIVAFRTNVNGPAPARVLRLPLVLGLAIRASNPAGMFAHAGQLRRLRHNWNFHGWGVKELVLDFYHLRLYRDRSSWDILDWLIPMPTVHTNRVQIVLKIG